MDHYPFWTLWLHQKEMEVCQPPYTENPLTPTNVCSGTATMPLPTNIVSLTHCYIEQNTFAPAKTN